MAEKTNAEVLYDGLIINPKVKGLPPTFSEFQTKVLQNPTNIKTLYDGLIQNPAIKGLPSTFDSFQRIITPPVIQTIVSKPAAPVGVKPIEAPQSFLKEAWNWVTDGLADVVSSFKDPVDTDKITAEATRDQLSTPETSTDTPSQQSFNTVKKSNETFQNVKLKLQKQYPRLDVIALNQMATKELEQLGYEYKEVKLPDGTKNTVWEPIPGFKPDAAWLAEQREILTTQKAEEDKKIDSIRSSIPGYKASQWIPTQALRSLALKLDENETMVGPDGKVTTIKDAVSGLKDIEKSTSKQHDDVSLIYTAPAIQPESNSYTGLKNTDFNNPETFNSLYEEADMIKESTPKTPAQLGEFKMKAQLHGVDMDYYSKPYLAAGFKWNNVVSQTNVDPRTLQDGPEKEKYYNDLAKKQEGDIQAEMFYAKGLQLEKLGLNQDIKVVKNSLDVATKNVATLQENIKNHGYYEGAKADLDRNLQIQKALQYNLEAKNERLAFYDEQEKGLTLYNDHLAQKTKVDRIAEVSPIASLSVQLAKMLVDLPGRVIAVGGDIGSLALSDAEKTSLDAEKLAVGTGSFWDYAVGKGTTFGTGYTGISPEVAYETPSGESRKGTLQEATTLDVLDEEGNWKITFNGFPTLYQTGKVGVESFMLGKAMFEAAGFFAPMKAALQAKKLAGIAATEEAVANSMIAGGEGAFALTGVETASSLGLAAGAKAITMAETIVGSIAPSIILFGDEMFKAELAKGLSHNDALVVSALRASIEGLTERAFPNEMLFYKMLTGKGVIKSYTELAANAGYRELIEKTFEKSLGKKVADKFVNYILNPSKAALKVWGEEGAEEVLGLLLGEYPNRVAKGFKNDYEVSESFTSDAAVSTMVQTMATMVPMGGGAFINNIQQYSGNQIDSKISVGHNPVLYIKSVQDMQKEGILSKDEADRRINYINKLTTIAAKTNFIAPQAEGYNKLTKDQQEGVKRGFFKKFIEQDQLNDAIKAAPTDEEKLRLAAVMDNHNLSLKTLLEEGVAYNPKPLKLAKQTITGVGKEAKTTIEVDQTDLVEAKKTKAEVERKRVENSLSNLNFYTSDAAIETSNSVKTLTKLSETLRQYSVAEEDTKLKAAYDGRIKKIAEKIEKIKKTRVEAEKTPEQKAVENNTQKKITIPRPDLEALNLEFGIPYHISSTEDISAEGKKIIRRPEIVINHDNGDGTLNVSWGGETANIDIADLAKFKFTKRSTVAKWRKEKDPLAFVFDNENNIFSYEFSSATKDREKSVSGRLRYNPLKKTVDFVYKTKSGEESAYSLDKRDLEAYRQRKGKLKLIRALETEAEFEKRQAKSVQSAEEADFNRLQSQAFRRFEFIVSYIEEKRASLKSVKKTISVAEDSLLAVEIEMEKFQKGLDSIEDIHTQKTKKVKADVRKLIAKLQALTEQHKVIVDTIASMEREQASLENEIEYLQRYEDDEFESSKSLANQLMDDLIDLEAQKNHVADTISTLNRLANGIQDVITKAVNLINNLIKGFESKYGRERTALSPEEVYDVIGVNRVITRQYGEEASFLKKHPFYLRNVELFQQLLDEKLKELELPEGELENLKKSINANIGLLEKIGTKIGYQEDLIKAAEKAEAKFKSESFGKKIQGLADRIFKSFVDNQSSNYTGDPEEDKEPGESAKIELRDLFTATTGIDDLSDPRTLRLQTFLNEVDNWTDHRLMVVTKDNAKKYGLEELIFTGKGITNSTQDQKDNDIVLVVVRKVGDKYLFVDSEGRETEKADPATVVYTSMRMARLTWESGGINFVDKESDLQDPTILEKAEPFRLAHEKFRQWLVDKIAAGEEPKLTIKGISRGFNTQDNHIPQSATEAAGLPSTVDLANTQVVFIPTNPNKSEKTGHVTYKGTNSSINMPKGRPVFSFGQHFFFLNNRRYTSKDVLKFQKIFKHLYDNLTNKKETEKIIKYLEHTLYIRNPETVSSMTDTKQQSGLGRSQIWITRDKDKNLLLHLHDLPAIPFNFEDGNFTSIFALEAFFTGANKQGVFHNVDAKNLIGKEFVEYYLGENNSVKERVWPSYQAYLISDKLPNGTSRPIDEIPLTTTLAPSTSTTPNKTGRYMLYGNWENEKVAKVIPRKEAATGQAPASEEGVKTILVSEIGPATSEYVGRKYILKREDPNTPESDYSIAFEKADGKFKVIAADGIAKRLAPQKLLAQLLKIIEQNKTIQSPNVTVLQKDEGAVVSTTPPVTPAVTSQVTTPATSTPTSTVKPPLSTLFGAKKGTTTTKKKFRVATKKEYTKENMEIAREWWEKRFPTIPFKVISGLVDGIAFGAIHDHSLSLSNVAEVGTVYHEAYEAVAAYFLNTEELEGLRNEFKNREGSFVEYGTGNVIEYSKASNDQIREQLAEEYRSFAMSNGVALWKGQPRKKSLFQKIFDFIHDFLFGSATTVKDIFEKISKAKYKDKTPFGIKTNQTSYRLAIQLGNPVLFRAIMNGMTNLLFQDLRENNIGVMDFLSSGKQAIIARYQQMRGDFDSYYGGENVISAFDAFQTKENFIKQMEDPEYYSGFLAELSNHISEGLIGNIIQEYGEVLTPQALGNLYDIIQNYKDMRENWAGYIDAHKEYLSVYKVEFEEDFETEEEDINNENKDQNEYARDMLKFSVKQNANTEIKMLIATLTKLKYAPGYVPVEGVKPDDSDLVANLNTMLMSELVDYGKVIGKLLHKLAFTTTFDQMIEVIKREAIIDPTYNGLLEALKAEQDLTTLSKAEHKYVVDLRNKFFTSLNNMKPDSLVLVLSKEDGSGATIDVNDANAVRLVKAKWLSDLKDQRRGLVTFSSDGKELKFNKEKFGVTSIAKERDIVTFLNNLGIDFTIPFERLTKEEVDAVLKATQSLYSLLNSKNADAILFENKLSSDSLTVLATVYIKYSDFYNESQHLNIDGEPVQNIILQNFIGMVTKVFNTSRNLDELIANIPQMTPSDRNAYISSSQIVNNGTLFFNTEGNRTRNIQIKIFEGARVREESEGVGTSSLAESDYIAQEFSHNLQGNYYILVPADAKTEWGVGFGHFVTQSQAADQKHVGDIMKKHLAAEIKAAQQSRFSDLANVKNYGLRLRQFEDILKAADSDFKLPLSYDKSAEDIIAENEFKIDEALKAYFDKKVNETYNYFVENNVFTAYKKNEEGAATLVEEGQSEKFTILFAPSSFIGDGLSREQVVDLIRFRTINYELNMIEQHKLFWGDPAQWKQAEKRTKSFMSGRNLSVHSAQYFNDYHNTEDNIKTWIDNNGEIQTTTLHPGEPGYINYDDNLRVQSFQDIIQIAEYAEVLFDRMLDQNSEDVFNKKFSALTKPQKEAILDFYKDDDGVIRNPYESNNEADGQGWSFPAGYREIRQRANTWTEAEDEQFEWDMALFRKDNKLYSNDERGNKLKSYDLHLIEQGNPYLNRAKAGEELPIQQVLKPIYSGYKSGDIMELDIRKLSIANLNWRLVKGTAMEPLYIAHVKANTTFMNVESANKIGLRSNILPLYENSKANTTVEHEQLSFKYFGIQVETKTQKDEATLGTQLTKLAILNLMIGGIPLDFIKAHGRLTKQQLQANWNSHSEEEKINISNHYKLVRRNSKLLSAMKILAKDAVFKEFGLEQTSVGGEEVIDFTNLEKFEKLIQRELKNRQAPENIKTAAQLITLSNGELKFRVPLDLQIGADKLESIITSIVDKRLLRPKMFGGQMPQIASSLLEKKTHSRELVYKTKKGNYELVTDINSLDKEERDSVRITSNDLHFYTPEEPWIEVMLPFYMQEYIEQGRELNIDEIPEELRWAVAFRIPTQELNSIEHIRIKGFLPVEYGNSIVVPTEITTKAGSDFDIDKLNIYLYNYITGKDGKPVKIEFLDNTNSTVEERYEMVKKQALRPYTRAITRYISKIKNKDKKIKQLEQDIAIFEEFLKDPEMEAYNNLVVALFDFGLKTIEDLLVADQEVENYQFEVEGMLYHLDELRDKLKTAVDEYETENPIEEFKQKPVELQNTKEAIDNVYIDNIRDLLSLEENFAQLVQPNSVTVLKREAYLMNFLWRKTKATKKSYGSYLDPLQNAFTRLAFLVGKAGVGIGAASQTLHAVAQMIGLPLAEPVSNPKFNFPTNSYEDESTGMRHYDIAAKLTTDKKSISSIISAFINAFVDVAKDPWILGINGNASTAGIYITAFKLGMPVKEVVRWFNQPVIKDYIKMREKAKSVSAALSGTKQETFEIVIELGEKYGFNTNGWQIKTTPRTGNYTIEELEGYIKEWLDKDNTELKEVGIGDGIIDITPGTSLAFRDNQANLLAEFRKLESISWDLFRVGQALNQDTTRTVNFDSIRNKVADVVRGLNGPFRDSIFKALEETFIGTIFIGKNELLQGMQSQYLTERPRARAILNPLMNRIFLGKGARDVKEKLAKDMRKEFLTYLLQVIPISVGGKAPAPLNSVIGQLFKRDNSFAEQLRSIQSKIQTGELPENFLLQNMLGVIPVLVDKVSTLKNVQLLRRMSDKVDSDHATSDWYNLGNHPLTREFMYDMIKFALLQNGLKGGPNSFTHLIPNELFTDMARQVDEFFETANVTQLLAGFEESYYRNNWWNRALIPKVKVKDEYKEDDAGRTTRKTEYRYIIEGFPPLVFKWAEPQNGVSDFKPGKITKLKYFFTSKLKMTGEPGNEEAAFDKATREKMMKKGDFSFLDQVLYKRVEVTNPDTGMRDVPLYSDKTGQYVNHYVAFYPVARYGKRGELVEHFAAPSLSYVNPSQKGLKPITSEKMHELLQNKRATGRFLSHITGLNEEDEDISLSLRPDLHRSDEILASQAARKSLVLFESAKGARKRAEESETPPTNLPDNTSQNPFEC